jgi:uncharacterized protein YjbJ (UPF0337 family)
MADKFDATMQKAGASVKELGANILGNDQMKAEAIAEKEKADAKYTGAQTKEKAESVGDNIKGTAKDVLGTVTGNDSQKAEGKADKAEADIKNEASKH